MTNYWDSPFINQLTGEELQIIFEVGARTGEESIKLSKLFSNAQVYAFECNPLIVDEVRETFNGFENIHFFDCGLGDKNETLPFYSFVAGNIGASSLYKRIDFDQTQKETGHVTITKLSDFTKTNGVEKIDLLCMDVQGYELNILKGAEHFIQNVKYIIMEEPKPNQENVKYIGAPSSNEIREFMKKNNFVEIVRLSENLIEDNVMYKRLD